MNDPAEARKHTLRAKIEADRDQSLKYAGRFAGRIELWNWTTILQQKFSWLEQADTCYARADRLAKLIGQLDFDLPVQISLDQVAPISGRCEEIRRDIGSRLYEINRQENARWTAAGDPKARGAADSPASVCDQENRERTMQKTRARAQFDENARVHVSIDNASVSGRQGAARMANHRAGSIAQRQLINDIHNSPRMVAQRRQLGEICGDSAQRAAQSSPLNGQPDLDIPAKSQQTTAKPNNTGLPDQLKDGIESLSGMSLDNVKVHYNASEPAQLNALAYARGSDIYLGPGQEPHLPHEAWHVVQQAHGRVRPTKQSKDGTPINDDDALEHEANAMGHKALAAGTAQLEVIGNAVEGRVGESSAGASPLQRKTGARDVRALQPGVTSPGSGVVQRVLVTGVQYLQGIVATNAADPEWDPQWTAALNKVSRDRVFASNVQMLDDASDPDGLIATLQALQPIGPLSNERPNPYRLAVTAVLAHAGIESGSGGSGFGDLDTTPGDPISGRPAFPQLTQLNVSVKSGQHRRHILAWHSIREFVSLAVAAKPGVVFGTIAGFVNQPPDTLSNDALVEAYQHVFSQREKARSDATSLQPEELLKIGLFVMNGNPRNLWPGKGTTNSAINTAQMHMEKALSAVTTFAGLSALAQKWATSKAKAIYATSTKLGADLIMQRGTEVWSAWEHGGKVTPEATEVAKVVADVRNFVLSNLQLDVLGDNLEQNAIVQEKYQALQDPIRVIDSVANGTVAAAAVPDQFLVMAIREFLTYAK